MGILTGNNLTEIRRKVKCNLALRLILCLTKKCACAILNMCQLQFGIN